jgi:hypothetical protein
VYHAELDGEGPLEDDQRGAPALPKAEPRVPAVGRVPPILKELAMLDRELTRWLEKRVVPFTIQWTVEINGDLAEASNFCARQSIHVDGAA